MHRSGRYASLREGLVGAWCPSVSGSFGYSLPDLSGHGNHGTLTNMDPPNDWVTSGGKMALDFDGVNDYVTTNLDGIGRSNLDISVWLFRESSSDSFYVGCGKGGSSGPRANLYILNTTTYLTAESSANPGYGYISNTRVGWNHFIYSFNGNETTNIGRLKLWINGVEQSLAYAGAAIPTVLGDVGNFEIGRTAGESAYGKGAADDCRAYTRRLNGSEIAFLYTGGRGVGLIPERRRWFYQAVASLIDGSSALAITTSGTLGGSGPITGTSSLTFTTTAAVAGSGSVTGSSNLAIATTAAISASGSLTGSVAIAVGTDGTASAIGTVSGSSSLAVSASGAIGGAAAVTGSSSIVISTSAALQITGSSSLTITTAGAIDGSGACGGSSSFTFDASGAIGGGNVLTGNANLVISTTAAMSGSATVGGSTAIAIATSATLSASAEIAGAAAVTFTTSAAISGGQSISGTATIAFGASSSIAGSASLAGSSSLTITTDASIAATVVVTGSAAIAFGSAGTLVGSALLSGSVTLAISATATPAGIDYASDASWPSALRSTTWRHVRRSNLTTWAAKER